MDPTLKECLTIDIVWEVLMSKDNTGDPTYAAAVTIKGFVTEGKLISVDGSEEKVMARSTIYLSETYISLKQGDRLTPPHDIARIVLLRNIYYDLQGGEAYLVEAFVR